MRTDKSKIRQSKISYEGKNKECNRRYLCINNIHNDVIHSLEQYLFGDNNIEFQTIGECDDTYSIYIEVDNRDEYEDIKSVYMDFKKNGFIQIQN